MSRQTKQIGGWGLVIALVGGILSFLVPFLWVIALVGWILALIGYFKASEEYGEEGIKKNTLIAVALLIVSWLVMMIAGGAMTVGLAAMFAGEKTGMFVGGAGFLIMFLSWVIGVAAAWFWYKANKLMSEKSGVNLFRIGGILFLVGEILMIVLLGGLILLAGLVVLIVAWFSVQEEAGSPQASVS